MKFKRRYKRKKASIIFAPLLGLLMLIVLIVLLRYVNQVSDKFEERPLGERQFSVLKTHTIIENQVAYMEMAAPYAFEYAIPEVSRLAGIKYSDCGTYRGNSVLNVEQEGCFPDEDDINEAFTDIFNEKFNYYLGNYPYAYLPRNNYEIQIDGQQVLAQSTNPLKTPIISTSSVVLFEPIEGDAEPTRVEKEAELGYDYPLMDSITVTTEYGDVTLNPSQPCDSEKCTKDVISGKAIDYGNSREYLVIQTTAGASAETTVEAIKETLEDSEHENRAVHYVIDRDGTYYQLEEENAHLVHAEYKDSESIGLAIANAMDKCEFVCEKYGVCTSADCITPVLNTADPEYPYWAHTKDKKLEKFYDEQMLALVKLVSEIMIRNNIPEENLITRLDNTMYGYGVYWDPGPLFPWNDFKNNVIDAINQYKEKEGTPLEVNRVAIQSTAKTSSSTLANVVNKHGSTLTYYAEKKGVPASYVISLVAQESAGDEEAISWSGCVGLGQFCYSTAANEPYSSIFLKLTPCRCGLSGQRSCSEYHECNSGNDDRFNPEKSAEAIAEYIRRLLNTFNNYSYQEYYAHASYNAGTGLVKTVINDAKDEYHVEDPTWDQSISVLEPEHVIAAYSWLKLWDEGDWNEAVAKVREIQNYAPRIVAYRQLYEEEYLGSAVS